MNILETHVEIRESVRSKDVFIIQTGSTKYEREISEIVFLFS